MQRSAAPRRNCRRGAAFRVSNAMKTRFDAITAPPRAVRLRVEARNCLDIAIGKDDPDFAAELIDEAIRLARRARELAAVANARRKFR